MLKYILVLVAAAAAAWGVTWSVGAFGGMAIPTHYMASMGEGGWGSGNLPGSNLKPSPKIGIKVGARVWRGLAFEAAAAYHFGHGVNDWFDNTYIDEEKTTLIPITAGANYHFYMYDFGVYGGGGGGYYIETFRGGRWWSYGNITWINYTTEASYDGPGAYGDVGLTYRLGPVTFGAEWRYTFIFNERNYSYAGPGYAGYGTNGWPEKVVVDDMPKAFKDTYADVLLGASYSFL